MKCLSCKSTRGVPIRYGYMSHLDESSEDGRPGIDWIWGGCVVRLNSPSHACPGCGRQWLDPRTPEGRAELRQKRRYESMPVPKYLRPLWPAWDDIGAHICEPRPFLTAAHRYRSLARLWAGTNRAEWMLWVYGRALEYGLVGGMYDGALRDFACWAARRRLDTLSQLPGTTRGPVELAAILDMVRRQRQGLTTQAAVEDALWEEEKYVRRSQDHKTQPYLAAFRACQTIVSSNGIAAAQTAAALAQELAGYHSSEGSAERIRALRRESAEQAVQLREMLHHPFVRIKSASPLIDTIAVRR